MEEARMNNNWVAVYRDELGDFQAVTFDRFEDATSYLQHCPYVIGVMTKSFFYSVYTEEELED